MDRTGTTVTLSWVDYDGLMSMLAELRADRAKLKERLRYAAEVADGYDTEMLSSDEMTDMVRLLRGEDSE